MTTTKPTATAGQPFAPSDDLSVRRATCAEDIAAVCDLNRAFAAWAMAQVEDTGPPGAPTPFDTLEAELAQLPGRFGPPAGCLLLARLGGAPVGCVGFRDLGQGALEIKRLFVRPEAWGRGVGDALLALMLAEARAAGHRRALLITHRELHAAQALYARHGFRIVPPSDEFPGVKPDIEVCMARPLDPPGAAA
jgi:GNAT superfamily N-acetyltransferase